MSDQYIFASAQLRNPTGLHARPSVKLTQLAKSIAGNVELALSPEGPWIDAKSPVRLMRVKAPMGTMLHLRVSGDHAERAMADILQLIERQFDEGEPAEQPGSHHG